jgi:hypothetical protein
LLPLRNRSAARHWRRETGGETTIHLVKVARQALPAGHSFSAQIDHTDYAATAHTAPTATTPRRDLVARTATSLAAAAQSHRPRIGTAAVTLKEHFESFSRLKSGVRVLLHRGRIIVERGGQPRIEVIGGTGSFSDVPP